MSSKTAVAPAAARAAGALVKLKANTAMPAAEPAWTPSGLSSTTQQRSGGTPIRSAYERGAG